MLTNLPVTAMLGAGVEVIVEPWPAQMRGLTPSRPCGRSTRLYLDGDDPYAFRIDLSELGLGQTRLLFTGDLVGGVTALQIGPFALRKRPDARNPRRWVNGALALGAAVVAVRRLAR